MIDSVERRRQVRVQHPPPVRVGTFGDLVDRCDRVLTATAGPKSVRSRLEPCLPLRLQCVDDPGLLHPFAEHGNPERALLSACLGMYTRLTGRACHGSELRCIQVTSSALAAGSSTTSPSMPAVLRPALISVTRRTLSSVLACDRSISFCRLRTFFRSPACDAVKIRCRRRRTFSWAACQSTACQSRVWSSGPFTTTSLPADFAACRVVIASNLPFGSGVVVIVSAQAHLTRVGTLS